MVDLSKVTVEVRNLWTSRGGFTRMGALVKASIEGRFFTIDPPQVIVPPDNFKIGDSWKSIYQISRGGKTLSTSSEVKVVAKETITVEAGAIETYKVVSKGVNRFSEVEMTIWFSPDFGVPVKMITKVNKTDVESIEWAKMPERIGQK